MNTPTTPTQAQASPNPKKPSRLELKIILSIAAIVGLSFGYFGLCVISTVDITTDPNLHVKNWNPWIPQWVAVKGFVILYLTLVASVTGLAWFQAEGEKKRRKKA